MPSTPAEGNILLTYELPTYSVGIMKEMQIALKALWPNCGGSMVLGWWCQVVVIVHIHHYLHQLHIYWHIYWLIPW